MYHNGLFYISIDKLQADAWVHVCHNLSSNKWGLDLGIVWWELRNTSTMLCAGWAELFGDFQ